MSPLKPWLWHRERFTSLWWRLLCDGRAMPRQRVSELEGERWALESDLTTERVGPKQKSQPWEGRDACQSSFKNSMYPYRCSEGTKPSCGHLDVWYMPVIIQKEPMHSNGQSDIHILEGINAFPITIAIQTTVIIGKEPKSFHGY